VSGFVLAPAARLDLLEIWDYYAVTVENVDLADRIRDELFAGFGELVKTPGMGHYRSDLVAEPLRLWRVRGTSSFTGAKNARWRLCGCSTENGTCRRCSSERLKIPPSKQLEV